MAGLDTTGSKKTSNSTPKGEPKVSIEEASVENSQYGQPSRRNHTMTLGLNRRQHHRAIRMIADVPDLEFIHPT